MSMQVLENNKVLVLIITLFVIILATLIVNVLAVVYNGKSVPVPVIYRESKTIGKGDGLFYLILGDSTSIAQGAEYEHGFVIKTSKELAKKYRVTYQNFGQSGARISDVAISQMEESKMITPDIVLVAVGANDVTHLTSLKSIESSMLQIINELRSRNQSVKIIFTGAASMGDVQRFIWPTSWLLGKRTSEVNRVMERVSLKNDATFAYIAKKTGPKFATNPQYFAEDNFHPNNEGYSVWTEVLNQVIQQEL
jgi:lysophospholipase L1-like esterase